MIVFANSTLFNLIGSEAMAKKTVGERLDYCKHEMIIGRLKEVIVLVIGFKLFKLQLWSTYLEG